MTSRQSSNEMQTTSNLNFQPRLTFSVVQMLVTSLNSKIKVGICGIKTFTIYPKLLRLFLSKEGNLGKKIYKDAGQGD